MAGLRQEFIDHVEELKHHTSHDMDDIQYCCCPMIRNIQMKYQFEWWYDGYRYNLWEKDVHIYSVDEIPYCYDNNLKNTVFQGKMQDLVEQEVVWAFLLFVNDHVIPWSAITIIHDYDHSYLRIDGEKQTYSNNTYILYFPVPYKYIRYGEDSDILSNHKGFYFNKDKKFLVDPRFQEVSIRLEFLKDSGIYMNIFNLGQFKKNNQALKLSLVLDGGDASTTVFQSNVIDGGVSDSEYDNKLIDGGELYENPFGIKDNNNENILIFKDLEYGFVPTLDNILVIEDNIFIGSAKGKNIIMDKYNGALSCFGINPNIDLFRYSVILLYYTKHTKSKSYIYTKDINQTKLLINMSKSDDQLGEHSVLSERRMFNKFNFEFNRGNSIVDKKYNHYNNNMSNTLQYVTRYDYALWNKVFEELSPIKSYTYTGKEFKSKSDTNSNVKISRRHSGIIQDVAMMFVNNKLYEHSIDIVYSPNTISLPVFGIDNDDQVEVVLFTKCNNNILDIVVPNENTDVYIHPEYNLNDCYIMDDEATDLAYTNVPRSLDGRKQYICNNKFTRDSNNNYRIKFEDAHHYGRRLKLVPKHQFRHYKHKCNTANNANPHDVKEYVFTLPTSFNYCHDIERFMIFVNGRRIDKSEFTVTIMNKYRPFDRLELFLGTELTNGDYIDIYYVPEYIREKTKTFSTTSRGNVDLRLKTDYPKLYALSKKTSMVFVNGYKINPMSITDISMNVINVHTKHKNALNVTVMEYINGAEALAIYLYGMNGLYKLAGDLTPQLSAKDPNKNIVKIIGQILDDKNIPIGVYDIDFSKKIYDQWTDIINNIIEVIGGGGDSGEEALLDIYDLPPKHKLSGSPPDQTLDVEKSFKDDYVLLRSVVYEIILDYYVKRNNVSTGTPFTYDFELDVFDNDNAENAKIGIYIDKANMLAHTLVPTPKPSPGHVSGGTTAIP